MSDTEKNQEISSEITQNDGESDSQPKNSANLSEDSDFRDSTDEFHSPHDGESPGEKNPGENDENGPKSPDSENIENIDNGAKISPESGLDGGETVAGTPAAEKQTTPANPAAKSAPEDPLEHVTRVNTEYTQKAPETPRKLPPRTYIAASVNTDTSAAIPSATIEAHSLLEARQSEISIIFDAKDASQQKAISTGVESVRKTYRDIRSTIGHLPSELLGSAPIDWRLWDRVIGDYHEIIVHDPKELAQAVANGIPAEIRGIVWQLVAQSKNLHLEELYMHLKTEDSVHEKAIKRDLTRTSFYTNVDAAHKAIELFNVIMAYSNFDPDVGYTQGMVFIAVPLIMNMTESECFCLLVTLMKEYGLRNLFCPEMRGLHLLLHQFDRLLERHSPLLFNHLNHQGIRSSMYASQWFLTFFSYKFPFKVVLRIFDMVITQGVEAVLRLALNLMLKNEASLLRLNFDGLLDFLKDSLFNVYVSDDYVSQEPSNRRFSLLARKPAAKSAAKSTEYYKLDAFIQDSLSVDVSPLDLARWKAEFDQILVKDSERTAEIETLRAKNGELRHDIKDVEMKAYALNHDHLDSVQTLVDVKVALPELTNDIEELHAEVGNLEAKIEELEAKLGKNHENIPQDIEAQIHELLVQNAEETERFSALEEQLAQLTTENEALKAELKNNRKWFWKK